MIRLPPRSTLFPYTTLFPSPGHGAEERVRDDLAGDGALRLGAVRGPLEIDRLRTHEQEDALVGGQSLGCVAPEPPRTDRKSTRLNSSHSQISYAVFCLKERT